MSRGRPAEIAPLAHLPIVRDLVTDRAGSSTNGRAKGQFEPTRTRRDDFARIEPASAPRRAIDAAIECIGCGVLLACDVVAWNADYLAGGAQSRMDARQRPARRRARGERLAAVAGDAGCHACHTHESCTERCPSTWPRRHRSWV
jgi:fumarate reductase iron-sulfur subunit